MSAAGDDTWPARQPGETLHFLAFLESNYRFPHHIPYVTILPS